jgi:hypothetical protein
MMQAKLRSNEEYLRSFKESLKFLEESLNIQNLCLAGITPQNSSRIPQKIRTPQELLKEF